MQKGPDEQSQETNGIRVLDGRAFLFHNSHIQSEPRALNWDCKFCSGGLAGIVKTIIPNIPEPEVVQSDGTDKKEDTPPTPSREWPW